MGRFKGVLEVWPQTSVKKQPIFTNFTNSYRDRRRSPPQPTGARRSSAEKKLPDNSESLNCCFCSSRILSESNLYNVVWVLIIYIIELSIFQILDVVPCYKLRMISKFICY